MYRLYSFKPTGTGQNYLEVKLKRSYTLKGVWMGELNANHRAVNLGSAYIVEGPTALGLPIMSDNLDGNGAFWQGDIKVMEPNYLYLVWTDVSSAVSQLYAGVTYD